MSKNSPKSLNYRLYKDYFGMNKLFHNFRWQKYYYSFRFRTLNNNLPIERGRWQNISKENRKCHLCNSGDEFQYLFKCTWFDSDRKILLAEKFIKRPNIIKFKAWINGSSPTYATNNKDIVSRVVIFIHVLIQGRQSKHRRVRKTMLELSNFWSGQRKLYFYIA